MPLRGVWHCLGLLYGAQQSAQILQLGQIARTHGVDGGIQIGRNLIDLRLRVTSAEVVVCRLGTGILLSKA